jgi:predicted nucleic-acid-binding protein
MICLDSNVVLRLLLGDDQRQSDLARELFGTLTKESPGFLTSVTMVEIAWTLGRRYRFSKHDVLDALENLLTSEELEFDDGEGMWRALLASREGADFADALIADTAQLFGCDEVATFDRRAAEALGLRLLS